MPGAGKTTLVEILEGHRRPTSGSVSVLGFDPETGGRSFRERIGIVLQEGSLEHELTVSEAAQVYAPLYPRSKPADEVIEVVGLTEKAGARIKTLSGGQKRRLELALGIVGNPDLIFLDEPTTGFDPSARRQAWELVRSLRSLGTTILLTTHYMDEAQNRADRIAVIANGRIVAQGTPETIGGRDRLNTRIRFEVPEGVSAGDLPPSASSAAEVDERAFEVSTGDPTRILSEPYRLGARPRGAARRAQLAPPSLEEVYLELTEISIGIGRRSDG